ncbi:MAG: metal ABC transporter substrate-binding protein [Chloroflexota bacterium]
MKKRSLLLFLAVLSLALPSLTGGCAAGKSSRLKVVTSTSLLSYITQQVGGDYVEIVNLIAPANHPGNFDVRPGDIQTLASAGVFLLHGWPGETYADGMIAAANNPDLKAFKIVVDGNWMTPPVQQTAAGKVADALAEVDAAHADAYRKAAEAYQNRVAARTTEIQGRLAQAGVSRVNVIASQMQAGFLAWAGMKVVATYGLPDSLTPQAVGNLVDQGKQAQVTLVADNLQSAPDAGKAVAEELGVKRVILSNFPGGYDDTETWEKAIDNNVKLILEAIGG